MEKLIRVTSNYFVAGLIMENDVVTEAAPILKWTIGKNRDFLIEYFTRKGWGAQIV